MTSCSRPALSPSRRVRRTHRRRRQEVRGRRAGGVDGFLPSPTEKAAGGGEARWGAWRCGIWRRGGCAPDADAGRNQRRRELAHRG